MVKVITYGTYDLLHYGHIRLLERAKAIGDYLIVGITSDDYDRIRGKINNQQPLIERIQAVKDTGLADEIIVEEYEGQKIDDIRRLGVDIFTVGSDWEGKFDYLNEYCKVVYLPRTVGISSSEIRTINRKIKIGIVGDASFRSKLINEAGYVNGVEVVGICSSQHADEMESHEMFYTSQYCDLIDKVDAVFIISKPEQHYSDTKKALLAGKHVLCESPIAETTIECEELFSLAKENDCILMDGIKTAYSTAFERLVLLAKSGKIGQVVSIDATCTSLRDGIFVENTDLSTKWNSMCGWAPIAMLPVFSIFGNDYSKVLFYTKFMDREANIDLFTKIDFIFANGVATIKVAKGAKSEGELIISGTNGYIYVPAPWWKTDYFELRFENQEKNRRFFYQLEGEGIRNEIVSFTKSIESKKNLSYVSEKTSYGIVEVIEKFNNREGLTVFD